MQTNTPFNFRRLIGGLATALLLPSLSSAAAVQPAATASVNTAVPAGTDFSGLAAFLNGGSVELLKAIDRVAKTPAAQRAREVIVFGDSLSDGGTYRVGDIAAVGGGKFTTNPGPVWPEPIGTLLGAPVKPFRMGFAGVSQVVGGTNYAMGGSRVSQQPGIGCNPDPSSGVCREALSFPVTQQIGDYLQTHANRFNSNQLVYVLAGANDLFFQLDVFAAQVQAGVPVATAQANALAATRTAAVELSGQVKRILSKGATRVGVMSMLDIADSIYARAPAQAALRPLMVAMVQTFNAALSAELRGTPARWIDLYAEAKRVVNNPGQYGVSELNAVACDPAKIAVITGGFDQTGSSLFCSSKTLVQSGAAFKYLYSDDIHPSSLGHLIIARFVFLESVRQGLL